ncbi:hypothetical protein HDU96_001288 [Phlyctochytrium bullatum]|nr:hypothetical protein HDU96_001288 [Phlyctochytrium bullatum]
MACRFQTVVRRLATKAKPQPLAVRQGVPTAAEYMRWRLDELRSVSVDPWPAFKSATLIDHRDFEAKYVKIDPGAIEDNEQCDIAGGMKAINLLNFCFLGRIRSRRDAGKALVFLDIERDSCTLQAVLKKNRLDDKSLGLAAKLSVGDHIRIDNFHNPEFTTCEFYSAYSTLDEVIELTELMIRTLVKDVTGSSEVTLPPGFLGEGAKISFETRFQQVQIIPALENKLEDKLPSFSDPKDALEKLLGICRRHNVHLTGAKTIPRILDTLISEFIEPDCIQPTFLLGHPDIMSPLAKEDEVPGVSKRFELFIGGKEIVNAYSEQNSPIRQREKFQGQAEVSTFLSNER